MSEIVSKRAIAINHAMLVGLLMGVFYAGSTILRTYAMSSFVMGVLLWLVVFYICYLTFRFCQGLKDGPFGGQITFGEAYRYVIWLSLFSGVVASVFRFIYFQWLNPDYLIAMSEKFMSLYEVQLQKSFERLTELSQQDPTMALPADYVEQQMALVQQVMAYLTPIRVSLFIIVGDVLDGCVLGLIIAAVVRRLPSNPASPFCRIYNYGDLDNNDNNA